MPIGLGLATLIGAGLSFGGGLIGNLINQNVAQENIAAQKTANQENIAFQKAENDITRDREDTAYQRAASDLTAAGLSKTLAAGQPASASALTAPRTQAVQNQFKYESALQKMDVASRLQDMAVKQKQLDLSESLNAADIAAKNAQAREADAGAALKQAQAAGQNLSNDTYMTGFENELMLKRAQTANIRQGTLLSQAQTKLARIEGDYKAQSIEASIKKDIEQAFLFGEQSRSQTTSRLKMISDMKVNDQNIEYYKSLINKTAQDIAESKAREYKLGYEAELVVKDLAKVDIEIASSNYNFEFSKNKSIRTTDQMSKLWGLNIDNLWNKGAKALKGAWHDLWTPIWKWSIFQSDH